MHGVRIPGIVVVVQVETWLVSSLHIASRRRSQGIELGRELGLGLDERRSVVRHGLVTGVWVLADRGQDCRHDDEDEQDKCKYCVHDEEDDSDDSGDQGRLVEDIGEDEQEDCVDEVDGADGDIHGIGALVHPWSQHTCGNQHNRLDNKQSDRLGSSALLGEGDEHALDEDVDQDWDDVVVGGSSELDVQETPLVQSSGVRVEDVCRVLVHLLRSAGNHDHLHGCPRQCRSHAEEEEDGEDNLGR